MTNSYEQTKHNNEIKRTQQAAPFIKSVMCSLHSILEI